MLELKNINVTFNKNSQLAAPILKNFMLTIPEGQFVTLIGGNGAGKSTLMNVLAGSILPDQGHILINGQEMTSWPTRERSPFVSRVFQDPRLGTFAELTIEENLSLAYKRGSSRGLAHSLNKTHRHLFKERLGTLEMGLENRFNEKVSGLSGGQRQALSLIMATLQGSKILLLDEHTAALDPKMARTVMNLTNKIVRRYQLTTLMVTHSMSQALTYGERTLMLYHGQIVRDLEGEGRQTLSPEDLLTSFDLV